MLEARFSGVEVQHVIVDDRSNDRRTLDLYKNIKDQKGICVQYSIEKKGPAGARNFGMKNTSADWFGFLDADDLFVEGGLFLMVSRALEVQRVRWIMGETRRFFRGPTGINDIGDRRIKFPEFSKDGWTRISPEKLLVYCAGPPFIFLGSMLMRSDLIGQLGFFDCNFPFGEDWWLTLNASLLSDVDYSPEPVHLLARGHASFTSTVGSVSFYPLLPTVRALADRRFQRVRPNLWWTLIAQLGNLKDRLDSARKPFRACIVRIIISALTFSANIRRAYALTHVEKK